MTHLEWSVYDSFNYYNPDVIRRCLCPPESSLNLAQTSIFVLRCSKILPTISAKFVGLASSGFSKPLSSCILMNYVCFPWKYLGAKLLCVHIQDFTHTMHLVWKLIWKVLALSWGHSDVETFCHRVSCPHLCPLPPSSSLFSSLCPSSLLCSCLSPHSPSPWFLCTLHLPSTPVSKSSASTALNSFPLLEALSHQLLVGEGAGRVLFAQFLMGILFY